MRALLAAVALIGLQGCIYYVYVPPKGDKECDRHDWDCEDWDEDEWDDDWDDDDWDDEEDEFCDDLRERLADCYEDRESRDECDDLEELYEDYCLEDDWDDEEDEEDEDPRGEDDDPSGEEEEEDEEEAHAELQEGSWVMVLTGPDKDGDCEDVLLAGIDYLRLEAGMLRLSEQEYLLETSYSQHVLFVEGETFFGEGIIEFDGATAGSYLEGDILAADELQGFAAGGASGCQITADLWGTAE